MRDVNRVAEFRGMKLSWPRPDPVLTWRLERAGLEKR